MMPASYFTALAFAVVGLLSFSVQQTHAWGAVGHEIVATIAQTQLHPDVRAHLCTILPRERTAYKSFYPRSPDGRPVEHCHLAPLAAWADTVRQQYPWASHLHYVNPVQDDPPQHCTYGEFGWQDHGTGNVLEALVNYTSILAAPTSTAWEKDLALRFVTHFMGDVHQPLHLTGRARGGNDIAVRFDGRFARLHTVWDSLLINDQIRELYNHTTPLPSLRIESALTGKTYDAYIRWILAEGLGQASPGGEPTWWREESQTWTECPEDDAQPSKKQATGKQSAHWLRSVAPHSSRMAKRIYGTIFKRVADEPTESDPSIIDRTDLPICPYAWSKPMHPLVCAYAFAHPVPSSDEHDGLHELNVPEYAGRISDDKIIQRQLARAGIRLAAVLNTLLLPKAQEARFATIKSAARVSTRVGELSADEADSESEPKGKHPKHGGHHSGNRGGSSAIVGLIKVTASSIAEVVLLSSVGYVLARQGILDKKTQTKFNKVNVMLFTPALLFSKVAFSLDPGRLAELVIVPAGFVIITVVSALSAMLLSWMVRLKRSQRNFTIACAITPNSNSLPVALMQSLVVTVPQLHWEEEGEPEDTVNGMLGRALTYLVLFSTLGNFLRWSLASQLLSTMEESEDEHTTTEEGQADTVAQAASNGHPRTGTLIDVGDEQSKPQSNGANASQANTTPSINVRRSTEDGGTTENISRPSANRTRRGSRPRWARSFPNSPGDSEEENDDAEPLLSPRWQRRQSSYFSSTVKSFYRKAILRPFNAFTRFMTMPLYAALLSLIVAMLPPVQNVLSQIEPLVGALETAGACSIPLTMVVLGAYFYDETDPAAAKPSSSQPTSSDAAEGSTQRAETNGTGDNVDESTQDTLVNPQPKKDKRKSMPFMRNPWKSADSDISEDRRTSTGEGTSSGSDEEGVQQQSQSWLSSFSSSSANRRLSLAERKKKQVQKMERRTLFVAVASRMLLTPIILLPLLAWYAIATRYNVVDDPVFITSACLLIGSPPALTLAQITSQNAKGSNKSFERLISKTIFISYAIMATPTTIVLVLTALLIAENDH